MVGPFCCVNVLVVTWQHVREKLRQFTLDARSYNTRRRCSVSGYDMKAVPVDAGSAEVLRRFHEGLPLVQSQALLLRRSSGRSVEFEDLVSHGQIGLWEAAQRYEPDRGVPFRVFARFRIRGAILDGIRQCSTLPRRLHECLRAFDAGAAERERATLDHLAGMATARVTGLVCEPAADPQSPDAAVAASPSPEHCASNAQLLQLVERSLASFPTEEAWLIRRHYLDGESLDRVAEELLLSKSWTSRLHTRALLRLTVALQHLGD